MIARQTAFFAPAAVMSAWGTIMLHTAASGHLNRLLSPIFRPGVLAAGVLLILLSVLYLLLYEPEVKPAPAFARTGPLRQIGRWLVLLIPVVAAAILSPSALSSTTLANRYVEPSTTGAIPMPSLSAAAQENVKAALAADPNQPAPMEVTDLITLARNPAQIPAFAGRKVQTVGVIEAKPGETPKLVRWIMWCCAADAQPASVELSGDLKGPWKDNQWVEVIGTPQFPSTLGHVVPQISIDSIKATDEPDEPYLSP